MTNYRVWGVILFVLALLVGCSSRQPIEESGPVPDLSQDSGVTVYSEQYLIEFLPDAFTDQDIESFFQDIEEQTRAEIKVVGTFRNEMLFLVEIRTTEDSSIIGNAVFCMRSCAAVRHIEKDEIIEGYEEPSEEADTDVKPNPGIPFYEERMEMLRELNGSSASSSEWQPLDPADKLYDLNKAAREGRPGTVENRIVSRITEAEKYLAEVDEFTSGAAVYPAIYAKIEAASNLLSAAQKIAEEKGITYYPEIMDHQGKCLVIGVSMYAYFQKHAPTEYSEVDTIVITFKTERTGDQSNWYPNSELFGLEFVGMLERESEGELTRTIDFQSTTAATTWYVAYLEARSDVERVEWKLIRLLENPFDDDDMCPPLPDEDDNGEGNQAPADEGSNGPTFGELPRPSKANRLITEALKLPEPSEDAREKILPADAAKIYTNQFPPVIIFIEGGAEQVDIQSMLRVLAAEARLVRWIGHVSAEWDPSTHRSALFVSLNLLNSDLVVTRLTEEEKLVVVALAMVLLGDMRVIDADWTKTTVSSMANRVLEAITDRSFGRIFGIYRDNELGAKQIRHDYRVRGDWNRWWSVAAEVEMAEWSAVVLPPIPDGIETNLDAQEREEERVERERELARNAYYMVFFDAQRALEKAGSQLFQVRDPDFEKVKELLTSAEELLENLSSLVDASPAEYIEERQYELRRLQGLHLAFTKTAHSFEKPFTSLVEIKGFEDLVGMKLHVPEEFLIQPGIIWDLHIDMMKEYGMTDPETGEEVTGEAVVPLFKKKYGERPDDIPAPEDNDTRITSEELYKYAEKHLEATDGVRIWWPGAAGTMDYLENRLNIVVNKFGRITDVHWG